MPSRNEVGLRTALYYVAKLKQIDELRGSDAWHQELSTLPLPEVGDLSGKPWAESFEKVIGQLENIQKWCVSRSATLPDALILTRMFPFAGAYLLEYRSRQDVAIQWFKDAIAADGEELPPSAVGLLLEMTKEDSWEVVAKKEIEQLNRKAFYWDGLGTAYYNAGSPGLALDSFSKALSYAEQRRKRIAYRYRQNVSGDHPLGITETECLDNMGLCYTKLAKLSEALDCHRRAEESARQVGTHHDSARNLANAAMALADQGSYTEAMRSFNKALGEARQRGDRRLEANCLGNIGIIECEKGHPERAIHLLEQALEIHRLLHNLPGESNTLCEIAIAQIMLGNFDSAIQNLQEHMGYLEGQDDNEVYLFRLASLGGAWCSKRELAKAREVLGKANRIVEQGTGSAKALKAIESLKGGVAALAEARSTPTFLHIDHPDAMTSVGMSESELADCATSLIEGGERADSVRRFFLDQLETAEKPEQIRVAFGMALDWAGKNDEAVEMLRAGAVPGLTSEALANQLAWAIVASGGSDEEARVWLDIARTDPSLAPCIADTEAWIRYQQGDYKGAFGVLMPYLSFARRVPEIAFHAAKLYLAIGDTKNANIHLKMLEDISRPFGGRDEARRLLNEHSTPRSRVADDLKTVINRVSRLFSGHF